MGKKDCVRLIYSSKCALSSTRILTYLLERDISFEAISDDSIIEPEILITLGENIPNSYHPSLLRNSKMTSSAP